jgi:mRNA-degrading endonuclease RelE of RelBE toxin-antitoxin system
LILWHVFFDKTVELALKKLSKEDKMKLLKNFQGKFTVWKAEKTSFKDQYAMRVCILP